VGNLTIREVAERAGVSVGTVSNALNRPHLVAQETLSRVQTAIQDLGFVRNAAARQMRGARSPAIGLVVLDVDNPFFTAVARGVEAAANEVDHLVIVCNSGGDRAREQRQLKLLEEQKVAGVLMTPAGRRPTAVHRDVRERGTPIVLLDRLATPDKQCSVGVDDVSGGRIAAEHLLELGHTRLALINGPQSVAQCGDRREGFLDALSGAGLELREIDDIEMGEMTIPAGEQAARRLLRQRGAPTAIFCANDLLALGAEHAILSAGKSIPGDVAVIGYDDVPFAAMAFVSLTTVRQPAYELGYESAQLLLDEASNDDHDHQRVVFEPELVVRKSTRGHSRH